MGKTELGRYLRWLSGNRGLEFSDYAALHDWSVSDREGFWNSIWEFFGVRSHAPYQQVLSARQMPALDDFVAYASERRARPNTTT